MESTQVDSAQVDSALDKWERLWDHAGAVFVRTKTYKNKDGSRRTYLHIVENVREGGMSGSSTYETPGVQIGPPSCGSPSGIPRGSPMHHRTPTQT